MASSRAVLAAFHQDVLRLSSRSRPAPGERCSALTHASSANPVGGGASGGNAIPGVVRGLRVHTENWRAGRKSSRRKIATAA